MTIEIKAKVSSCACCEYMANGNADPDCTECGGSGKVANPGMKLATVRFMAIWSALGLDTEAREIDPQSLLQAIAGYRPGLAEMGEGWYAPAVPGGDCYIPVHKNHPGAKVFIMGMNDEMVKARLDNLKALAIIAETTGGKVSWA